MDAASGSSPAQHDHHRDITGGSVRAAVFGLSDGLVSNVSLILGVAGADPGPGVVRLAGLAGLIAGACSMAAGEYGSMRAQVELLERELDIERRELARNPQLEQRELTALYESRGIDADTARAMASEVMQDPEVALATHAREELGVAPDSLGSPVAAAVSSFVAFAVGAAIPLLPWLVGRGTSAVVTSCVLAALTALVLGAALARTTQRPWPWPALRQLLIAAVPAAVSYLLGRVVGVTA